MPPRDIADVIDALSAPIETWPDVHAHCFRSVYYAMPVVYYFSLLRYLRRLMFCFFFTMPA